MDEELRLKGHGWIVYRLAAVPVAAGRTLLASGDTDGAVRIWDPATGRAAGPPLVLGDVTVQALGAIRLPSGTHALVTCAPREVALWDPARPGGGPPLRRFALANGRTLAVVPATTGRPELLVTVDRHQVRVIDPDTGAVLFKRRQPRGGRGRVGDGVHKVTGVRITDRTAGFAAVRHGGSVELCYPRARGRRWETRPLDVGGVAPGTLAFLTGRREEPLLALGVRRGIAVWDLRTGHRVSHGDFAHGPCTALAPVPLAGRTVLAAAFGRDRGAGVRIWDPERGRPLGPVLHRHGPAFGDASLGGAAVHAVVALPGADGAMRVASAGSDGLVRVSPAARGLAAREPGDDSGGGTHAPTGRWPAPDAHP